MEKENEIKTVVPALRFPEFQGMIGWEKTYIYEECPNPYSGGTPKTTEKKYYGGNIPFIRSAEIGKDKTELSITQEGLNNSSAKMIQKGDLLIALYGANSGDIAISKIDGAINQAILCLKAKSNNLFIYYTLLKKQKDIVSKYLQGGQGNLSGEIIKSIDFYIPQKIEQQKIAYCLSSLDDLIEATAQKVDALKEHKKGLMQRLFPADGKNVPDLRFPRFQASEKWERKIIQDICNITTGNKNTQDKKENGIYPFFVRSPKVERIDSWSFDGEAILTAGDGVGVGKIFHYYVGKMGVHQRVYLLYDIQCNSKYLYYFFSEFFYERVKKMSAKNSVDSVRKDMISDMPLLLPSSQEQQKIADCLSSLDELIEATSQKVEILKEHKKGLMQQLFPKI